MCLTITILLHFNCGVLRAQILRLGYTDITLTRLLKNPKDRLKGMSCTHLAWISTSTIISP